MFGFKKRDKNKILIISILFSRSSKSIEVQCTMQNMINDLKGKEDRISDELYLIKKLIPDKMNEEPIEIRAWLKDGAITTTINYSRKLNKYIGQIGDTVAHNLNKIFSETLIEVFKRELS